MKRFQIIPVAVTVLACVTLAASAQAQNDRTILPIDPNWKPAGPVPRMPDGKPKLTGVWWQGADFPVIEPNRPAAPAGPRRPPQRGDTWASLMQPWAVEKAKTLSAKNDPSLECIPSVDGPAQSDNFQIVQDENFIVYLQENFHGFRLIPTQLGRQHSELQPPAFHGDAVGHWEGDTLVVHTNNFSPYNWIFWLGNVSFHSEALEVVERYTRTHFNTLEVQKTYTDPKVLTDPWIKPKKVYALAPFDQIMEALCTSTRTADLMRAAEQR
jgi:hypothetical protein